MLSNKQVSLGVGGAIALAFLFNVPSAWKAVSGVKDKQVASNEQLVEWKASYEALLPINDRFRATYPSGNDAKDLVALYRLVAPEKHGLYADVDLIRQISASPVEVNGMPVGLQRLCVGNDADYLSLSAASIGDLRRGLKAMSERRDIDMGSLEIAIKDDKAVARVKGMCLKVRTEASTEAESGV
ncbi:MAG: hypothetical protein H5U32_03905 [Pseudomonas balearica]|uniref:hypothetical protein n=1 Tax=Stutzerimonas balearica TaxID=74829 RepID=UPI0019A4C37D|nr:hypothetical protein [Stutzerimonas balearica]MBC7198376.1 hypothetical protein [Stutzerimonas balearica]